MTPTFGFKFFLQCRGRLAVFIKANLDRHQLFGKLLIRCLTEDMTESYRQASWCCEISNDAFPGQQMLLCQARLQSVGKGFAKLAKRFWGKFFGNQFNQKGSLMIVCGSETHQTASDFLANMGKPSFSRDSK
jgi:hypothetical protein